MKLIVGLGNPGKNYDKTRHNFGYMVIDSYAEKLGVNINKTAFNSNYGEFNYNGEKVFLVKPETYMNLSGEAISGFVDYYHIDIEDILIIHDDLDLPIGKIRLRYKGSPGGHNGLKDIEEKLGTDGYKRLKLGISNDKNIETKDYVLGKFTKDEKEEVDEVLKKSKDLISDFLEIDFTTLMSKYNN